MKISIIIPNYNGEKLLKKNLSNVYSSIKHYKDKTGNEVELIVIDDCSSDQSVEFLKSQKEKLLLIENEENVGFAKSVNKAVEQTKGEILVLLNSDVSPEKDFLIPLLEHFEDVNIFAVGCMDKSIENKKTILRGRGIGKWQRGFMVHSRGEVDKTNTLWVNGGSGAFRKSIWQRLGGFNVFYYPFYWEDIDMSYRALKAGYSVLFESKSIVVHAHEEGAIKKRYSHFQIRTISYKNQFIFVWLNIKDLFFRFQHVLWLPYHCVKALMRCDMAFFVGFFMAVLQLPEIIIYNYQKQKSFKKTDREILTYIFS